MIPIQNIQLQTVTLLGTCTDPNLFFVVEFKSVGVRYGAAPV